MPNSNSFPPDPAPRRRSVPFDPGISQTYYGDVRRIINKDGTFNVRRSGTGLGNLHVYQYLLGLSWPQFLGIVVAGYMLVNTVFAFLYVLIGIQYLHGADDGSVWSAFFSAFFFSAETFTTVGYGNIAPQGLVANFVAALEAAMGLMGFAVAAALFFGRFSRPHAKLVYSEWAIIAPYQGGRALMFRIANERSSLLMELQARVLLMTVEKANGSLKRVYRNLELERSDIDFLPLTWTVVHPIDERSPFHGMDKEALASSQAEILVQLRGFDDTFNWWVHSRNSYRHDEIVWGARFLPAFRVDSHGESVVDLDLVHAIEAAEMPPDKRDEGGGMKDERRAEAKNEK